MDSFKIIMILKQISKGDNHYLKLEAPRSLYSSPGYNNNISQ